VYVDIILWVFNQIDQTYSKLEVILEDTYIYDLFPLNAVLSIGPFTGYIRELKIWSTQLSYNMLVNLNYTYSICKDTPNLVAYWQMDDCQGYYVDQCELFTTNIT